MTDVREIAERLVDRVIALWECADGDGCGHDNHYAQCVDIAATALADAERATLEHAARIAEAFTYHGQDPRKDAKTYIAEAIRREIAP